MSLAYQNGLMDFLLVGIPLSSKTGVFGSLNRRETGLKVEYGGHRLPWENSASPLEKGPARRHAESQHGPAPYEEIR